MLLPRNGYGRTELVRQLTHLMYCAYYPELPRHRKDRIYYAEYTLPPGFGGTTIVPVPDKPKPKPKLDDRYEKCLAQVGLAEQRVAELEKKLARAQKHLDKKRAEAAHRLRRLEKPLSPTGKTSDTDVAARLRQLRKA
jgi:hypothetical protein